MGYIPPPPPPMSRDIFSPLTSGAPIVEEGYCYNVERQTIERIRRKTACPACNCTGEVPATGSYLMDMEDRITDADGNSRECHLCRQVRTTGKLVEAVHDWAHKPICEGGTLGIVNLPHELEAAPKTQGVRYDDLGERDHSYYRKII